MQYFYINSNSVNPTLRMELVNDGRYDFFKNTSFNESIQNADITFTMWDENDVLKISKAPCTIFLSEEGGCDDRYIIEYAWKKRDTNKRGIFTGRFEINFNDDLKNEVTGTVNYPKGLFIMPIYEDLKIHIK